MNYLNWRSGRDYLDYCDEIARRAWRERDDSLDWMWYPDRHEVPGERPFGQDLERSLTTRIAGPSPWTPISS
ncbi:MAG: hypothetical protein ACLTKG_04445 [Collinsella intestinalis]